VLLLAAPALGTILFGAVDPATWVLLYAGSALVLGLWIYDGWSTREISVNPSTLLYPMAGLILIGMIQLLPLFQTQIPTAAVPNGIRDSLSMDPYATRLFVGRLLVYTIYFAAALTFLGSRARIRKAVIFTIVFGSIMAIFAILQRLGHVDAIYGIRDTPGAISFGPFVNQHHFAAFLEMTGGIVFGFLFSANTRPQTRVVLGLAAAIMGIAVVMTSSRGGMISFTGALLLAIAVNVSVPERTGGPDDSRGRQRLGMLSGAAALLVVIIGTVLFVGADSSFVRILGLDGGDLSNGRIHFWGIALRIFAAHPLLGAGLDAFGVAFTRYDTWPGIYRIEQAHNDYLQTLADAGLAGFACVAVFIYLLFKKGIAAITTGRAGLRRSAAVGALCGCFGILVHSFFDFPLRTPSNAFFFLLLTAIAVTSARSDHGSPDLD